MSPTEQLAQFTGSALARGASRPEIRTALLAAGWSQVEVEKALSAWADGGANLPPIPRPAPSGSAREAIFYGLKFMAYLMVIWTLGAIGFQWIDILTTPASELATWRRTLSSWDLARLIIFLPLFVALHLYNLRLLQQDQGKRRSSLRRWLGNGALLIAALTALGDAVILVATALGGDLNSNLLWKALLVASLAGLSALFFRFELSETRKS